MKVDKFDIPIFDWSLTLIQIEQQSDYKKAYKTMKKFGLDDNQLQFHFGNITNSRDGGLHGHNNSKRESIIFLHRMSHFGCRLKIMAHELNHLVNSILNVCEIEDMETSAYLSGYITLLVYDALIEK